MITDVLYGSCRLSKDLGILEVIKFPSTLEVETNLVIFEQVKFMRHFSTMCNKSSSLQSQSTACHIKALLVHS